jgi:NADH-quinone oxidoreductase subunit N
MMDELWILLPELLLIGVATAVALARNTSLVREHASWIAAGVLGVAGVLLATQQSGGAESWVSSDTLAGFGRGLALLIGFGLVLMPLGDPATRVPTRLGLLLGAVAGVMLAAGAGNLFLLAVGIEGAGAATFGMLVLGRGYSEVVCSVSCDGVDAGQDSSKDGQAVHGTRPLSGRGVVVRQQFFVIGVVASVVWLYGLSFVYGMAGSMDLEAIRAALSGVLASGSVLDLTGLTGVTVVLLAVGLGFKVAAVPFHFQAIRVSEGATYAEGAWLATLPRVAGLLVLARVLVLLAPNGGREAWGLVGLLAALSMTYGNVMALRQDKPRRLLAYASIGQTGYLLLATCVALAAGGEPMLWRPIAGMFFYLAVSTVAMVGAFGSLAAVERADEPLDDIEQLAGLGRTHPVIAGSLAVCLLSLAGVAPLAGFWANLAVLGGALEAEPAVVDGQTMSRVWLILLAVLGAVNLVVGAGYYFRLLGVIYFRLPLATLRTDVGRVAKGLVLACALMAVGIGLCPGLLWRQTSRIDREMSGRPDSRRPVASEGASSR